MRPIKFRGISESLYLGKRDWVYGDLIRSTDGGYFISTGPYNATPGAMIVSTNRGLSPHLVRIIPETLGQLTGQTDKTGKQIWEGDTGYEIDTGHIFIITFEYGCFLKRFIGDGFDQLGASSALNISKDTEITGTIHDHLLNKEPN